MINTKQIPSRLQVGQLVFKLVEKYNKHPFNINCGDCESFAEDLVELIEKENLGKAEAIGAEEVCTVALDEFYSHFVVKFEDRFYDAEEPFGVKKVEYIPSVARAIRNFDED
jgi:hypothetical protein